MYYIIGVKERDKKKDVEEENYERKQTSVEEISHNSLLRSK